MNLIVFEGGCANEMDKPFGAFHDKLIPRIPDVEENLHFG